jgi:hypothetical protein
MTGAERDLIRRRALGWGFRCEPTGEADLGRDLVLAPSAGGVELARVEGIDNLSQDLTVALTTLLGDDPFATEFGFDGLRVLAEEPNTVLARERIRIAVIRTVQRDARVRRITDVQVEGDAFGAPLRGSRELDVRVQLEVTTGEPMTVGVGRILANG